MDRKLATSNGKPICGRELCRVSSFFGGPMNTVQNGVYYEKLLKAIHAQESRDAADCKARTIVDDLRAAKMHTAADLIERCVSETLTYYAFPDIHWHKIRTNNPFERIMREIRRRTRVVGAFPDGQSCLNLAAARLRYIAASAWSTKRYMNMRPLYQTHVVETGAVA
jgi:putative transposase